MDKKIIRKNRVRGKARIVSNRPRLSYEKSNRYINIQLIDDSKQKTIFGIHQKNIISKDKTEMISKFTDKIVEALNEAKINEIYIDRGARKYHGSLATIVEGLRKAGVKV